jgi:hypothetical protein
VRPYSTTNVPRTDDPGGCTRIRTRQRRLVVTFIDAKKEIRRERALVCAAVIDRVPDNDVALVIEMDTSDRGKSSKRMEELARLKALKANVLSSEGGLGGIGDEGKGLYTFVDTFHPFIHSLPLPITGRILNVDPSVVQPSSTSI